MRRRNEVILTVARQQNGHALGRYDLENEMQYARLDFVRAAKLVAGRVHPQKRAERSCFRGLVWSGTTRRAMAMARGSLHIGEHWQPLIHFVLQEMNKTPMRYSTL